MVGNKRSPKNRQHIIRRDAADLRAKINVISEQGNHGWTIL